MRNVYILFIFFIIFLTGNYALAMDYFPELGLDPFYSSLNPENNPDKDSSGNSSNDTIFNLIKNKKNKHNEKQSEVIQEDITSVELKENNGSSKKDDEEAVKTENTENSDNSGNTEKAENRKFFIFKNEKPNSELTPAQRAEAADRDEKIKEKELQKIKEEKEKELKPSFRDNFYFLKKKPKKVKEVEDTENKQPDIELSADYMEYFPERYEVEAVGNAKILFTKSDAQLSANKLIFNYDRNVIKAYDNVVLTSKESVTEGDFIKIDLSKPEGFIENPMTTTDSIKLSAKNANIYSDKIEENDGIAKILQNEVLRFGATSFDGYVDPGNSFQKSFRNDSQVESGIYSLKAKTIYIDSLKDHEVITVKNAGLYFRNKKIAVVPSAKIVSNKQNTSIETNFPEFGSQSQLGMHIGPAVVLNVPGGSTLKLAPILTYKDKLGFGGIARFKNQYNMTEVAYGTSKDQLILKGEQKLGPGLKLNYSRYTNENEWFLGYRMPKYSANLSYTRSDDIDDLKLRFSQYYSAGVYVDNIKNKDLDLSDAEGRFRWMTQSFKPIYSYSSDEGDIGLNLGLVAQTAATVYTTGDVTGIFRIGPTLKTRVGPWQQSFAYYQAAMAGDSPFDFDRYRYGHSNFIVIESLKISKYLSVGYLTSIAMNREVKSDDKLQENRILLSIGPDYAKFTIGYDSFRRNTMFLFSMLVGTQDSNIEFNKAVLKNPQNFGSNQKKEKPKKRKSVRKYLKQIA